VAPGSAAAARLQEQSDGLTYGYRDLRSQSLARDLRSFLVRVEERHAVRALGQMATKSDLLVVGEGALEILEAKLDELLTADHGLRRVMAVVPFPSLFDGGPKGRFRTIIRKRRMHRQPTSAPVDEETVQVNDASPSPRQAAARDEPRTAEVRDGMAGGRKGARFRAVMDALGSGTVLGGSGEMPTAAMLGAWFRPEAPRSSAGSPPSGVAPAAAGRLLIGTRGELAEARIRIGTGPLAGTELAISAAPGGRLVEAALLTCAAGSRQTLSVAMDEIRLRLRAKGITLVAGDRLRYGRDDGMPEGGHDPEIAFRSPSARAR
jgi:hypothetical protein